MPAVHRNKFSPQKKNMIMDVKPVMEGVYRILDIIETHMSKLNVHFKKCFTKYVRKKKKRI